MGRFTGRDRDGPRLQSGMKAALKKKQLTSLVPRVLRRWYARWERHRFESGLNNSARKMIARDARGDLRPELGPQRANELAVRWICLAQDMSASADGGVARHYSLVGGWSPSYPE